MRWKKHEIDANDDYGDDWRKGLKLTEDTYEADERSFYINASKYNLKDEKCRLAYKSALEGIISPVQIRIGSNFDYIDVLNRTFHVSLEEFREVLAEIRGNLPSCPALLKKRLDGIAFDHNKSIYERWKKMYKGHIEKSISSVKGMNGYTGTVNVAVVEARDLAAKDVTGTSDPFCIVFFDKNKKKKSQRGKTKVIHQNLFPIWNENFSLKVPRNDSVLHVRCYDWDKVGKNYLGEVEFSMRDLEATEDVDSWFKLFCRSEKKSKVEGDIHLRITYDWKEYPTKSAAKAGAEVKAQKSTFFTQEGISEESSHAELYKILQNALLVESNGEVNPILRWILSEFGERHDIAHARRLLGLLSTQVEELQANKEAIRSLRESLQQVQSLRKDGFPLSVEEKKICDNSVAIIYEKLEMIGTVFKSFPNNEPKGALQAAVELFRVVSSSSDEIELCEHLEDLLTTTFKKQLRSVLSIKEEHDLNDIKGLMGELAKRWEEGNKSVDLTNVNPEIENFLVKYALVVEQSAKDVQQGFQFFSEDAFPDELNFPIFYARMWREFLNISLPGMLEAIPEKPLPQGILPLYVQLKKWNEAAAKHTNGAVDPLAITEIFQRFIQAWIGAMRERMTEWVSGALKADSWEMISGKGALHSSSIVDIFSALAQQVGFLLQLDELNSVVLDEFVQAVCDTVNIYINEVKEECKSDMLGRDHLKRQNEDSHLRRHTIARKSLYIRHSEMLNSLFTEQQFSITPQFCVKVNNLHAVGENLGKIIQNVEDIEESKHLELSEDDDEKLHDKWTSVLRFSREALDETLELIPRGMTPQILQVMKKFGVAPRPMKIRRINYLKERKELDKKKKEGGQLEEEEEEEEEEDVQDEVAESFDLMSEYLDGYIEILSDNLYFPVFQRLLKKFYDACISAMIESAIPTSTDSYPLTKKQIEAFSALSDYLKEYFHAGGEGVQEKWMEKSPQLERLNTILGYYGMPIKDLKSLYFQLVEKEEGDADSENTSETASRAGDAEEGKETYTIFYILSARKTEDHEVQALIEERSGWDPQIMARLFDLPKSEVFVESFTCLNDKGVNGKIYISSTYCCFNALTFSNKHKVAIPLLEVLELKRLDRNRRGFYLDNSMGVFTKDGKIFRYHRFMKRETAYQCLIFRMKELGFIVKESTDERRCVIVPGPEILGDDFNQEDVDNIDADNEDQIWSRESGQLKVLAKFGLPMTEQIYDFWSCSKDIIPGNLWLTERHLIFVKLGKDSIHKLEELEHVSLASGVTITSNGESVSFRHLRHRNKVANAILNNCQKLGMEVKAEDKDSKEFSLKKLSLDIPGAQSNPDMPTTAESSASTTPNVTPASTGSGAEFVPFVRSKKESKMDEKLRKDFDLGTDEYVLEKGSCRYKLARGTLYVTSANIIFSGLLFRTLKISLAEVELAKKAAVQSVEVKMKNGTKYSFRSIYFSREGIVNVINNTKKNFE